MCANVSLRHRPFSVVATVLALLVPVVIGCGSSKGKVNGEVTLDGKPLPGGTITFHPSKGNPVGGEITDGKFSVTGVPTGTAKVTVATAYMKQEAEALGMANQNTGMSMGRNAPPGAAMPPEAKAALEKEKQRSQESASKAKELRARYREIPEKYTQPDTSGLSTQIKSGVNNFEVQLSSK